MKRKSTIVIILLLSLSVLLNLAAWAIPGFSDGYVQALFPIITAPLARLTSLLPFSIGEWLLLAAIIWIVAWAVLGAAALIGLIRGIPRPGACLRRFTRATCGLLAIVVPVMTLNCFILYHTTPIEESLDGYGQEYTIEELGELRDYIVEKCNTLAEEMPRDEDGEVVYEGGAAAMEETAREAVSALGEREGEPEVFARLGGWQVVPKTLYFSDFVSQQYIQGYYYPFSMEANYNSIMKVMNKPSTMCHELAHTKGFIYEDEANLIGFLACIYSEDVVFQYSGWLSVLYYVNNSYYANVDKATYQSHPAISDRVRFDNEFLSDEAWEEVEEDAVLSTETVKAATDTYLDTTLKANGVESGKASYTHVVELLLMYYNREFGR